MALLCNDCIVEGKTHKIICERTDKPCMFMRFCQVSGKYYQTDGAGRCKLKGAEDGKQDNETDAIDRV